MTLRVYMLLDRSGSMASEWSDTLGAINTYVRKLADNVETSSTPVTLVAFDSHYDGLGRNHFAQSLSFDVLRRNNPAYAWTSIKGTEVSPRGGTPLYDATGRPFNMIVEDNPEKAVVVIMTDGDENTSQEVTHAAAQGYVKALNKMGYEVVFLGANFKDVSRQSASLGGFSSKTINTTQAGRSATFEKMAAYTTSYAATGQAFNFTAEDRKDAEV